MEYTVNGKPASFIAIDRDIFDVEPGHPEWKGYSHYVDKSPRDIAGYETRRITLLLESDDVHAGHEATVGNGDAIYTMTCIRKDVHTGPDGTTCAATFTRTARNW